MTDEYEYDDDQPEAISIESPSATSLNPSDDETGRGEHYKRLWHWNEGLWKSRNRVDEQKMWKKDRLNVLNAIATELELSPAQKSRASNIIKNANFNQSTSWEQISLEASCFAICLFVFNKDVKPRRKGSCIYLPDKDDEDNPDHFVRAKDEIGLTDAEISKAVDQILKDFLEPVND